MNTDSDQYQFYWKGPFSQWHPSEFLLDGEMFQTAEQAMMYLKAKLFNDEETATEIQATRDPGKQKALGRKVRGFDDAVWDRNKVDIVTRVNLAKFSQNKGLRRKLFQTGDKILAEASPLDTIWGIGLSAQDAANTDPAIWPGQNLLGQIITNVRASLALQHPNEVKACAPAPKE